MLHSRLPIFQRLKLSPIVGYLLAGVAVGPFTPGFVAHGAVAAQFAELGVILLMFGVGALLQVSLSTAAGAAVALFAGWSVAAGLIYGLALGAASTVVAVRMLTEGGLMKGSAGPMAMGWLVVEDLLTVFVLVLLPIVLGPRASGGLALPIAIALAKVAALIAFTMVVGRRTIPALLAYVAGLKSRELYTLAVLAIVLGIAVGAAELFGASMALGAFLAGLVVGQSDQGARATADALPMRDAFSVLSSWPWECCSTPRSCCPMGTSLKILPDKATQCLVAVSIASITSSPFLLKAALKIFSAETFDRSPSEDPRSAAHR